MKTTEAVGICYPGETTGPIFGPFPLLTIGTCSLCGGRVVVPQVQVVGQFVPPRCVSCHAERREPVHGPIIDMQPKSSGK